MKSRVRNLKNTDEFEQVLSFHSARVRIVALIFSYRMWLFVIDSGKTRDDYWQTSN